MVRDGDVRNAQTSTETKDAFKHTSRITYLLKSRNCPAECILLSRVVQRIFHVSMKASSLKQASWTRLVVCILLLVAFLLLVRQVMTKGIQLPCFIARCSGTRIHRIPHVAGLRDGSTNQNHPFVGHDEPDGSDPSSYLHDAFPSNELLVGRHVEDSLNVGHPESIEESRMIIPETADRMQAATSSSNGFSSVGVSIDNIEATASAADAATAAATPLDFSTGFQCDPSAMSRASHPAIDVASGKFLMLTLTFEQLSQARLHFLEAMALARLLNRTLVLTTVAESQIRFTKRLPFCSYFDVNLLSKLTPWVTQKWFVSELRRLGPRVTSETVMLVNKAHSCHTEVFKRQGIPQRHVLYRDLQGSEPWEHMHCVYGDWMDSRAGREGALMREMEKVQGADLLLVYKPSHQYFLTLPRVEAVSDYLEYAPQLHRFVESFISRHLTPTFTAIHWRLEWMKWRNGMRGKTGPAVKELFETCAASLVTAIRRMQRAGIVESPDSEGSGVSGSRQPASVFVAADMMPGVDFSDSMKVTIDNETRLYAGEVLSKVLGELQAVTWPAAEPDFLQLDSGHTGILDKLVCMKSVMYLTAPIECGGGHTFSEEIRSWRQRHGKLSDAWVYVKE